MIQLNPTIPVYVVSKESKGYCIGWIDYSQEHFTLWMVALDNGEVWTVPQSDIRFQTNISMGRSK